MSERSFCATAYGMRAPVGAACEERPIRGARCGRRPVIRGARGIEVDGSRANERNSGTLPAASSCSRRARRGDLRACMASRTIEQPGAVGARGVRYIAARHFDRWPMPGNGAALMLEAHSA